MADFAPDPFVLGQDAVREQRQIRIVQTMAEPPQQIARMPLPRDPAIAEREEFDRAKAARTREALELFIDRHPDSRFRTEAEAALHNLSPHRR